MPGNDSDLVIVPLEAINFAISLPHIEDLDLLILAACQEPVAVDRVPPDLVDSRVMCRYCVHSFSASARVPNFHLSIFASIQEQGLCWVPVARLDVVLVIGEDELFFRG